MRPLLLVLCRFRRLRSLTIRIACRIEGGIMFSQTLRWALKKYYGVDVGMYTYGPAINPGHLPRGTKIGNYCSLADGVQVLRRNHPTDGISQHPLFFNSKIGLVEKDLVPQIRDNPLTIGHDVWIGQNVLIAPSCRYIGDCAIIAAGAVVAGDVPPFTIVGGIPAKVIRRRLPEEIEKMIASTEWWLKTVTDLAEFLPFFLKPLSEEAAKEFQDSYFHRFGGDTRLPDA